jgi:tetratricopeptide (TPR) repeat protein
MNRADRLSALMIVVCAGLVYGTQLPARAQHRELKETTEAYLLPPPRQVKVMSLGYRSALADVLWANVLVTAGLRLSERRRFDVAVNYLDAINELDPSWRDPYKMATSLITMQTKEAGIDQVRAARRILERGVRERPTDAELWLILGQFVAWIVPASYLEHDPELAAEWKRDGAQYLQRAAELAPGDQSIQWQTLGAGRIFGEIGDIERAAEMYTTILATTEDPELRTRVLGQLEALDRKHAESAGKLRRFQARKRKQRFLELVVESYPGTLPSETKALLLGYPRDPAACAGGARSVNASSPACSGSWVEWAERDPFGGATPDEPR